MKNKILYPLFLISFFCCLEKVVGQGCVPATATVNAGAGNPSQSTVSVCASGSNTITFTIPGGPTDHSVIWQYSTPGAPNSWTQLTVSPNNTQFENVATFANAQPGNYRYQSGVSACGGSFSNPLTLSGISGTPSAPTLSASSTVVCSGNPVTLNATSDNSAFANTYYIQPASVVSNSVSVAGNYYATATNVCGESPSSNIITLTTGNPPTKPTITLPSLPLCDGGSGTLTSSGDPADTYAWYLNGTLIPGQTNQTISVSSAGDYKVEETNGCGTSTRSDPATVTVAVTPSAPTVSPIGPINLCDNASQVLTATGTATLTWYFNGSANGSTGATFTASAQGNYTVKSINTCGASPASNQVSIFTNVTPSAPTLNVSGTILLCNGNTQLLSTTPLTTGGVIHWSTGATGNSITVSTAGNYYAYESNSTCGSGPQSATVTITTNNNPVVNAITGTNKVCVGSSITLANTTSGGVWSSPDNSIATVDASGNVTGVSAGTINIKYAVTNSCGTTNVFKSITVNGLPLLNPIVGFNAVCKNASILLTNSQAGGTWSSGTPANGTIDGLGNVTGVTGGTTTLITYSYTDANSCSNSVTKTITINALPVVSVSSVMNTTNVVMTAAGANTYSWSSGEATQSISKPASSTATYNVVGTDLNGCSGNALYSVNSSPNSGSTTINSSNGTVFCNGSSTTLSATSGDSYYWSTGATTQNISVNTSGTYTVYVSHNAANNVEVANITITVDPTTVGGTVTANATVCSGTNGSVLNLSGSTGAVQNWEYSTNSGGSWTSIVNTSTSQVYLNLTTTTLYRAVVKSGSCPSANSSNATITVNPIPDVNTISNQVVCNNASTTGINFSGSVFGTTYNWVNNTPSIGLSASGAGSISSFNALNGSVAPVIATITVTPTAAGCVGPSKNFTITVNPTPSVNSISNQTLCNGSSTTAVSFNGPVGSTSYSWVNNTPSIGLAASGSGNISSFIAGNNGNSPVVATVIVTPTANGCTGPTGFFSIKVNPTPSVNSVTNQTLCNGSLTNAIILSGTVSGTVYNWTNDTPSIGIPGSGVGDIASFAAINNGTAPITATITVSPISNTCVGPSGSFSITVNPTPKLSSVLNNNPICDSTAFVYAATSLVSGTTFTWTRPAVAGITTNPSSGSTAIINEVLKNASTDSIVVNYNFILSANGCNNPQTVTVAVRPTNRLSSAYTAVVCDSSLFSYTALSSVASKYAPSFSWTRAAVPGISNAAGSGGSSVISEVLKNTTTDSVVVKYAITMASATGCSHTDSLFVTVRPTNRLSSAYTAIVCDSSLFTYTALSSVASKYAPSFSWTRAAVPGISNAAGSGGSSVISERLIDTGYAIIKVPYAITMVSNGCVHTDTLVTTVINRPYGSIVTMPVDTVIAASPLLLGMGSPDTLRMKYAWNFGDGITANTNLQTVKHYYYSSTNISPLISLRATNAYGCYRTIFKPIVVLADSTPKPIDTIAVQHHYKMVVFPNPFTTVLHLQYSNPGPDEEAVIRANDMGGNNIYIKRIMLLHGDHIIDLPIDRVEKKQVYNFWLSSKSFKHEQKFYRDPAY